MFEQFCALLESSFGGKHYFTTNSMGHTLMWIENGTDLFFINLTDKERFGEFTLHHQGLYPDENGKYRFHKQSSKYTLSMLLYEAYSHFFEISNNILHKKTFIDDYRYFMRDWKRMIGEN